ncbi:alpha/beta fold hydrolase [Curvivirga aplysinae]|uniref:alpha/beta fold hydrolase n=1 Tax=Curvivirga aplysinae TaxID=2529852 RepID=UPI0012BCFD35|nr:alpha/beta hydrolase [Curvivirga aplysinae]MTI10090.1 alpha/beta hydrolase [Curvivirga aplysinae]
MMWTTQQRSDFGQLKAIIKGEGQSIVLLHGVGLRAEAWNSQINTFSQSYEVIAPDMPGHGASKFDQTTLDLSSYTKKIAEAIIEPAIVIGHSMGAMIALDLAIHHPEKVKAAVALNAIFQRDENAVNAVQTRAKSLDGKTIADPTGPLTRWFADQESDAAVACKEWLTNVNPAGYKNAYTVFATENGPSPENLRELEMPALFITGEDEPNSTPTMSETMAALTPKGQVMIIKDAAHMMPMTHMDEVNQALLTFIKEEAK